MEQAEWERLSPDEKKRQLFLRQKKILQDFLDKRAISQEQFDKSFGDMMSKMGFDAEDNDIKSRNLED